MTFGRPMRELNVEMLLAEHGGESLAVVEVERGERGVEVAEDDL